MVRELKEGHLYELMSFIRVATKDEITLDLDSWMGVSTIYLYLDHCPYSETHALLEIKKSRIIYTKDHDHLLRNSWEVIYRGGNPKKIR